MKDRASIVPQENQEAKEDAGHFESESDLDSEAGDQPTTLEGERTKLKSYFIRGFGKVISLLFVILVVDFLPQLVVLVARNTLGSSLGPPCRVHWHLWAFL